MTVSAETQITDLTADDHACLTFGEPEELFDLTAAFVRDGLAGGLKVVWLADAGPQRATSELARRGIAVEPAMAAGQMATAGCADCLLPGQAFTADGAMGWLGEQIAACRREGFSGLRVAVDMSWALRPVTGVEQLPEFEKGMANGPPGTTVSVLCQYDRDRFDPVTLASVTAFHTRSVAAATYHSDAMLRICRQYAPPGIRLAGQLDYSATEPLALALAEAIRLDGDVTVNMTGLAFIDGACARMILDTARALPALRAAVLRCRPEIAARFALLGADDIPGVRLVSVHDG
ncbi:MAG: MEDS domain-containing protein [Actinobacteria bacterium]|nr:MEDS domain-containing protein [Actinomycetota bacterium]